MVHDFATVPKRVGTFPKKRRSTHTRRVRFIALTGAVSLLLTGLVYGGLMRRATTPSQALAPVTTVAPPSSAPNETPQNQNKMKYAKHDVAKTVAINKHFYFHDMLTNPAPIAVDKPVHADPERNERIDFPVLQAASYKSEQEAQSLLNQLAAQGLAARIDERTQENGTRYRVLLGPFSNESKMSKAEGVLAAQSLMPLRLSASEIK
jgi:cell division protein FtsN